MNEQIIPVIDYNHVFLYAKHHYKESDKMDDLRVILSKRFGIPKDMYSDNDIYWSLLHVIWKFNLIKSESDFIDFIFDISPHGSYGDNYYEALVSKCLSIIRLTIVRDDKGNVILNIGSPDYSILPKPLKIMKLEIGEIKE